MATQLLDSAFIARLERLDVLSRKILAGKLRGEHLARRRGSSPEFDDFREYAIGDDLRFIDWNLYARLDRLFVRLFREEEKLFLHLLVDVSASCNYGDPNKLHYLKQIAAAIGYVGLVNRHWVSISAMAGRVAKTTGLLRGRSRTAHIVKFLSALDAAGPTQFASTCRSFSRQRGICVVLSDFFMRDGLDKGLEYLLARGHELFCIQALSPQEIEPERLGITGDCTMRDLEELDTAQITLSPPRIAQYKLELNALRRHVEQTVTRLGGTYVFARTDTPFDRLVLDSLRHEGLLH